MDAGEKARLRLHLLGTFEAALDGEPLAGFRSDKARALLAFLAVEADRPHRREALAALLWGEFPERLARRSLSQALSNLRQLLAPLSPRQGRLSRSDPTCLSISRHSVEFHPDGTTWIDVIVLDNLLAPEESQLQPSEHPKPSIASLERAADLYRGPFLAGLSLPDCPEFEEWRLLQAEERHMALLLGLEALANHYLAREDYHQAQAYARRQLALEPWREHAHRQLMIALALDGQRGAALQQYDICRRQLDGELGIGPDPDTVALREQIWKGELAGPARPVGVAGEHALPPSPYRGLYAFGQDDARWFFGREAFVQRLVDHVGQHAVMAVIGPSGSGKSSAVLAGLLPRLQGDPAAGPDEEQATRWQVAVLRPGARPIEALAQALVTVAEPASSPEEQFAGAEELARALQLGQTSLCRAVEPALGQAPTRGRRASARQDQEGQRLLLVVDQFEELYTLCPDDEIRQGFLRLLLEGVAGEPPIPCTLLLVFRADYMGQALSHRPLADALEEGSLILGPMSREELARAVEQPALAQGVTFEPGLVERIVHDVGTEAGNLPLLQFALTALWQRQATGGQLTHTAYDATGRVQGALANYAEEVYGRFGPEDQERARRVLMQLVRSGHHARDTRRLTSRAELGDEDWTMVRQLADARLVVTGHDPAGLETAELVHEALIEGWERLDNWLHEDRAFGIWWERLRASVRTWIAAGRDEDVLLRGGPLAEAEGWYTARGSDISPRAREYIEAGLALRERERQAARDRQQRELESAQALAESERKRADDQTQASRRLRWLAAALGASLLVVLLAAGLAFWLRQEAQRQAAVARQAQAAAEVARVVSEAFALRAEEQAQLAEAERERAEDQAELALSRQLAAQSVTLLDKQLDLALLLNLEARKLAEPGPERGAYLSSLTFSPYLARFLHGHSAPVLELGRSPEGRTITSLNSLGGVVVWDLESESPIRKIPPQADEVTGAISADGRVVAVAEGLDIVLWDAWAESGAESSRWLAPGPVLRAHTSPIRNLVLNAGGTVLVSGDAEGAILVWDLALPAGKPVDAARLRVLAQPITYDGSGILALRPDGQRLAMAAKGSALDVYDLVTGELVARNEAVHPGFALHSLAYSPDGKVLATTSFDKTVQLWDAETVRSLGPPIEGHEGRVLSAAFSSDGRKLASVSTDSTVRVWDISRMLEPGEGTPGYTAAGQPLYGHSNWVRSVTFLPDGRGLVSGDGDGHTILWDTGRSRQLAGHQAQVRGVCFSPDGRMLASSSLDRTILLWDLANGEAPGASLTGHTKSIFNLAWSPAGDRLASVGAGREAILWQMPGGAGAGGAAPVAVPLEGHQDMVYSAAFSPDGKALATGDRGKIALLWDVKGQEILGPPLEGHEGWLLGLAFSPDGQTLASACTDGTARLWEVGGVLDGSETAARPLGQPLEGHSNWVNAVAFGPDGSLLATGSSDNTVRLWDVGTCMEAGEAPCEPLGLPLTGHTAPVWSLAFLPDGDGRYLLSGSNDGTVLIWDLVTREPVAPPLVGLVETETMALNPDGKTVAMGAMDPSGTVYLWDLDLAPWEERACQMANRNLSLAEWRQYLGERPYEKTCPELP